MNTVDLIGVIAKEDMTWRAQEGSRQTVFLNGNNQLQYSVQCLMSQGDHQRETKFYTGYLNSLEQYGLEEAYYKDSYTRIADFKEMMADYLLVFNAVEFSGHMKIDNVALTIKPSCYEEGMTFESVPYFTTQESIESFIGFWQKNKWLGYDVSIDSLKGIPFIFWQPIGTTKLYCIGGDKDAVCYQEKLYVPPVIHIYELTEEEKQKVILSPRYLGQEMAFIETGLYEGLTYEIRHQKNQASLPKTALTNPLMSEEHTLLERLRRLIKQSGFHYSQKDILNFHTALKTKSIVILEGMSGTGKSRLVDFYRQALGLDHDHYRCISVKASWTDESDLLGYPDMMNQCYRPDHEGVVDLLLHAQSHPEELYLLCFDEMNLARVEHYFSQFLSVLEMDESQQVLRLYNETLDLKNKKDYPATIALRGNVLFVGTINKDESTHHFSDKVLDRANVIKLGVGSLKDLYDQEDETIESEGLEIKKWSKKAYFKEAPKERQGRLYKQEIEVLEALHQLLSASQYDKGVGYRIVRQIEAYLWNLPKHQTLLTREEAFDLQIAQRILSKLRGDRMSLEGVLISQEEDEVPLMTCLERFSSVSEFALSKKEIQQKVKALKCYGYTM